MSRDALRLINRDESRHVAMDFYMLERHCAQAGSPAPAVSIRERLRAAWSFVTLIASARPFIRTALLEPLDVCDPEGRRMREAFKRMQLVARRPEVAQQPFIRFLRTTQVLFDHPVLGRLLGPLLTRIVGMDARMLGELYTDTELQQSLATDMQALANDAMAYERRSVQS
ncbi:MAG: hypothetical protein AB1Z98_38035 [Nannocystaceae bacterium]